MTQVSRQRALDRRTTPRPYDDLLPDFYPVKLLASAITVDFLVGGQTDEVADRLPGAARAALREAGVALDTRVSARKVLSWLRSMPSYQVGVQVRLGHDDTGLAFDKMAELIHLIDTGRSLVYQARRPLADRERAFFSTARHNLLLELTATPRSASLGITADPLEVVQSAAGLDPGGVHWFIGPLAADGLDDAIRLLEALPRGSRLTLRSLPADLLLALQAASGLDADALARLEQVAHRNGHTVTDWACRNGVARVGRGFGGVDQITAQHDLVRRAHDLITCSGCPARTICHGTIDEAALLRRLPHELQVLGLTATGDPVRTGPHAWQLDVAEPFAPGDETYLSHALGQPMAISLTGRPRGRGEVRGPRDLAVSVLRRWYRTGFLPVTELNSVAEKVLEDLRRVWTGGARSLSLIDPPASSSGAA
jgi:hypothetical protein